MPPASVLVHLCHGIRAGRFDEPGDWIVTLLPTELRVEEGSVPSAADATVAANASDLWLLLGGRSFGAQLRVIGDRSILERFEAALQMATIPPLS